MKPGILKCPPELDASVPYLHHDPGGPGDGFLLLAEVLLRVNSFDLFAEMLYAHLRVGHVRPVERHPRRLALRAHRLCRIHLVVNARHLFFEK